ncbi:MaoC family dehydratase [Microbacterium sp. LWH7-1.2]|uniref:MaoC family dehydratase n=1 Tax=Microbacterium sp. LWH7-1.2 TaxID=3135257 RepID=UPI00313A1632
MSEPIHQEFEITREQVTRYADVAVDHNPLHLDDEFARERGFPGAIAHGLLTLGLISSALEASFGSAWTSGGRIEARFSAPVPVGARVRVDAAPIDSSEASELHYSLEARVADAIVVKATVSVPVTS